MSTTSSEATFTGAAPGNIANYNTGPAPVALNPDRIPNPSASTLGGIQSLVPVAHEWIDQISTSGIPLTTQPTYSDLAGPLVYTPKVVANSDSPYDVVAADMFLAVWAGVSTPTVINLPAATGSGRVIIVKKVDSNAQDVTVTAANFDIIDGTATVNISAQYTAFSFIDYAAGQWGIMSTYP